MGDAGGRIVHYTGRRGGTRVARGGKPKPVFTITVGDRVTAMSGVVVTSQAGVVRLVKPFTLEAAAWTSTAPIPAADV
jgi:hypothetical protein